MLFIQDKLLSDEILETNFVCNLKHCKGLCCVQGDEGAPLEDYETKLLDEIYPKIKHRMRPEGIAAIEKQGTYTKNAKGELATTLVVEGKEKGEDQECAFATFDEKGVAGCAIESAYYAKEIDWKKPVSCHLYPIRVSKGVFETINYDEWDICDPACSLGRELQIPLYQFLKEGLIRKFGEAFYYELDTVAKDWKKKNEK